MERSLEKIERFGKLAKWAVELNGLGVKYQPKKAIKVQALTNFFVEQTTKDESEGPIWQLLIDRSSRLVGLVLITPEGNVIEYDLKFQFKATNNEAEYKKIIVGVTIMQSLGSKESQFKN